MTVSGGGLLPLLGGDEVMRAEPSGWDQGPSKETTESPPLLSQERTQREDVPGSRRETQKERINAYQTLPWGSEDKREGEGSEDVL